LLVVAAALVSSCGASINEHLLLARHGDIVEVREAIVGIGGELASRQSAGFTLDEGELEAVAFLRDVAERHSDPVSRMAAISALSLLRDPTSTDTFLRVLDDAHFGVRWEAAKALAAQPSPRAVEALEARLEAEPRAEVRLDLIKALIAIGDRPAIAALLRAFLDLSDRYGTFRSTIHRGLVELTGREYPLVDERAWREYAEQELGESTSKRTATPRTNSRDGSMGAPQVLGSGEEG